MWRGKCREGTEPPFSAWNILSQRHPLPNPAVQATGSCVTFVSRTASPHRPCHTHMPRRLPWQQLQQRLLHWLRGAAGGAASSTQQGRGRGLVTPRPLRISRLAVGVTASRSTVPSLPSPPYLLGGRLTGEGTDRFEGGESPPQALPLIGWEPQTLLPVLSSRVWSRKSLHPGLRGWQGPWNQDEMSGNGV